MVTAGPLIVELPVADDFRPEYLRESGFIPLRLGDGTLEVAARGTPAADLLEDLSLHYGAHVALIPVDPDALEEAIRRTFAAGESVVELVRALDAGEEFGPALAGDELTDLRDLANQAPVVRYVNLLVREAHAAGASDIHLEAARDGLRARLRVDGVLAESPSPPRGLQHAVVSRVKLLAGLDIAERRRSQDGRIRVRLEARDLDLRVSTVPTLHGESVVVRLLDHGGRPGSLGDLGMPPDLLAAMTRLARRPHGILLATGPTGSGKTTTLYAALDLRDRVTEKILTVEDPVEYDLPGIAQVPIRADGGMGFADALRGILRQDPDVLMIGEMRDGETARIAVQAAMTGHLVLSTLHTNDAPSAVTRLRDLGVEPYLVAATLEGVVAQRLVRRSCPSCLEQYDPDPRALAFLCDQPPSETDRRRRWERGAGCVECRGTGFRGRTGIFELLPVDEAVRAAALRAESGEALMTAGRGAGMRTLREDGWRAVRAGLTTVEEVLRVLGA
jgi:general secretion pathway protein E